MFKSSFIVIFIFIQLTVLLLALNFYLAPKTLSSHCVSADTSSKQLGNGTVVDCIACYQQDNQIMSSTAFSSISIIIPRSLKHQSNLNLDEPFQFLPGQSKNSLNEKFLYSGAAYLQEECQKFQCSALYQPKDFSLNQATKTSQKSKWTKVESFSLNQSSMLGLQLLNSNFTTQKYRVLSTSLSNQPKQNSLALKFRYNVVPDIEPQFQPVFILYSNQNTIFIRLLLLAPLLLSLHKILGSIFNKHHVAKYLIYGVFFSGIFSQNLLIITAALCIYLTLGELIGKRYLGFFLCLLYFVIAILLNQQVISITVLCVATCLIVYVMFLIEQKNRENYQNMAVVSIVSFNIFLALLLNWPTLAFLSVCQFLTCFSPQIDHKPESKQSYSGIYNQELEEQQDMVVKIEKQLSYQ